MTYLPDDVYALVEESVPLLCVDFVPVREAARGREVGLIMRDSPFGAVWCHLGGRVLRGETLVNALRRHARDTLTVDLDIDLNAQPGRVYEWFPADLAPEDGTEHGQDPRKHSVGLSYVVTLVGEPSPRNEAIAFDYFPVDGLPDPMWPGSAGLLQHLVS